MTAATKLTSGQKHILKLIRKEADEDGWSPVIATVYRMIASEITSELVTLEPVGDDGRGRVRLTDFGASLIDAMEWL